MKGGGKAGRGFQAAEIVVRFHCRRFHLITNSPENDQNIHDLMKADFHCAAYFSKKKLGTHALKSCINKTIYEHTIAIEDSTIQVIETELKVPEKNFYFTNRSNE